MAKKTVKSPVDSDIARKIWLAGVGAYGRVLSETQERVGKLAGSANEAFDQLVSSGEAVEDTVRARIAQSGASERVVSLVDTVAKQAKAQREALEERIGSVRKSVVDTLSPYSFLALVKRVDALEAEVAKLKGTAKKTSTRRPVRKATTSRKKAA
jgi:poly(hydroxyalkanoate) granule-associated protein